MNVLVTGGSGRIGRYVVRDLVANGHTVLNVDVMSPSDRAGRFLRTDLTDAGEAYQAVALARADAVVHLAAWANAGRVPDTRTYGDNVRSTFHVLQACLDLGVERVVVASSAQVYGLTVPHVPPRYVPMDENHPIRPANCYALSKAAGEQAAQYFCQRGMTVLTFRFMGVRPPESLRSEIDKIAHDPAIGARLLWTRLDARDAALACRLAIECTDAPFGVYNISGSRVVLDRPSTGLVRRYWGTEVEIRDLPSEYASPLSSARAEATFGFCPRYVWSESMSHPNDF